MENLVMFDDAFHDKTVWLSGHTGFKGSWLALWLLELGARVRGYALPPPTSPAMFQQLGLGDRLHSETGDVRDSARVRDSILSAHPDFVFHLAAQPIVRLSYAQPVETYATNVMGTVHVLDALRQLEKPCAAVFVTTDKCYENREWVHGYREEDPVGGHDPYSSSKAAAEIAISSFRRSFLQEHRLVRVASARAGNVIGGGDWAADRIMPDSIRALRQGLPIPVRHPRATRPWQHVLEPLSGYLLLAGLLSRETAAQRLDQLCSAFNFGPDHDSNRSVAQLVDQVLQHWPGRWEDESEPGAVHEAGMLRLSTDKAHALLGWRPVWDFKTTAAQTIEWYRQVERSSDTGSLRQFTRSQVESYAAAARKLGLPWAAA